MYSISRHIHNISTKWSFCYCCWMMISSIIYNNNNNGFLFPLDNNNHYNVIVAAHEYSTNTIHTSSTIRYSKVSSLLYNDNNNGNNGNASHNNNNNNKVIMEETILHTNQQQQEDQPQNHYPQQDDDKISKRHSNLVSFLGRQSSSLSSLLDSISTTKNRYQHYGGINIHSNKRHNPWIYTTTTTKPTFQRMMNSFIHKLRGGSDDATAEESDSSRSALDGETNHDDDFQNQEDHTVITITNGSTDSSSSSSNGNNDEDEIQYDGDSISDYDNGISQILQQAKQDQIFTDEFSTMNDAAMDIMEEEDDDAIDVDDNNNDDDDDVDESHIIQPFDSMEEETSSSSTSLLISSSSSLSESSTTNTITEIEMGTIQDEYKTSINDDWDDEEKDRGDQSVDTTMLQEENIVQDDDDEITTSLSSFDQEYRNDNLDDNSKNNTSNSNDSSLQNQVYGHDDDDDDEGQTLNENENIIQLEDEVDLEQHQSQQQPQTLDKKDEETDIIVDENDIDYPSGEDSTAFVDRMDLADAYDDDEDGNDEDIDAVLPTSSSYDDSTNQSSFSTTTPPALPTGSVPLSSTPKSDGPTVEYIITPNMRRFLIHELGYTPHEVRYMKPDVAAVIVTKRLKRPETGMPIEFYIEGTTVPTKVNGKNTIGLFFARRMPFLKLVLKRAFIPTFVSILLWVLNSLFMMDNTKSSFVTSTTSHDYSRKVGDKNSVAPSSSSESFQQEVDSSVTAQKEDTKDTFEGVKIGDYTSVVPSTNSTNYRPSDEDEEIKKLLERKMTEKRLVYEKQLDETWLDKAITYVLEKIDDVTHPSSKEETKNDE